MKEAEDLEAAGWELCDEVDQPWSGQPVGAVAAVWLAEEVAADSLP